VAVEALKDIFHVGVQLNYFEATAFRIPLLEITISDIGNCRFQIPFESIRDLHAIYFRQK
jgi:hypothetical protein